MKEAEPHDGMSPAERIADYIARFADWRGPLLARLRTLILEADPALTEEWKWDIPVWSHKGNVVAISAFKDHVKLNFFKGAALHDAHGLFNAGLEATATRAIDLREGDDIDGPALTDLLRAAVAENRAGAKR